LKLLHFLKNHNFLYFRTKLEILFKKKSFIKINKYAKEDYG